MTEILAIESPPPPAAPPADGPLEIEIKLAATPTMLDALRTHPRLGAPGQRKAHSSTYFDTADHALAAAGASLRLRHRAGACEQTLKLTTRRKSQIHRSEWNQPLLPGATAPDAAAFPPLAARALNALVGDAPLLPYAEVAVERELRMMRQGAAWIELAFDRGDIRVPGAEPVPVAELELELQDGDLADALALALDLPLGPELGWSIATKAQRAQTLASGQPPAPVSAAPVPLTPGMSAARGLQAIGWGCLGQWLGNAPLVVSTGNPGAVHQARVAIRRLRAAFALFGRALLARDPQVEALRDGLRMAARALGPARDLHVLRRRVLAHGPLGDAAGQSLLAMLAHAEAEATHAAQVALAGEAIQRLPLQLALWLERGDWLTHEAAATPVAALSATLLDRQRKRLRGMRRHLAEMSDAALHDLRLDVKKLRYAVDFFTPLCPDVRGARAHERVLGELQDVLGDISDAGVGQRAISGHPLLALPPAEAERLAQVLAADAAARPRLITRARQLLAEEKGRGGWWR